MTRWMNSKYIPFLLLITCLTLFALGLGVEIVLPFGSSSVSYSTIANLRPSDEVEPRLVRRKLEEVVSTLSRSAEATVYLPNTEPSHAVESAGNEMVDLHVNAIAWSHAYASAILNGKLVRTGDRLEDGSVIVRILPGQIDIRRAGGIIALKIHGPAPGEAARSTQ